MKLVALIVLIWLPVFAHGQQKCACPENYNYEKPTADKTYKFKNGQVIGLCGFTEDKGLTYSEFALFNCATNKIIAEWSATATCTVTFSNDTLKIEKLYLFPIKGEYKNIPFRVVKIYFSKGTFKKTSYYQPSLLKYSSAEISNAIKLYKTGKRANTEANIEIADKLFCAFVSGSKEAEVCFLSVKEKLGPFDGAIAELWDSLLDLYKDYKKYVQK